MNDIQIFNNAEFGEIRTVINDDGVWFVAKDIAEKLGYSKTANMTKLIDEDDRMTINSDILSRGSDKEHQVYNQRYQIGIINESGLYAAIFGSKQPNAKKFKKWVTSEVLPSIRKTGSYNIGQVPTTPSEQIKLLAQGHVELERKVDEVVADVGTVKDEIKAIKNDLPILPLEADLITKEVRTKGVNTLGGKTSNAYKDRGLRQRIYNNLYAHLKYQFDIKSYKALKRCQVNKAVDIIRRYEPPVFLQEQIRNVNAQLTF